MLLDADLNARWWPGLQVQVGRFKEPVGLEWMRAADNLTFVEYGYPKQLTPNRDVGVQVHGRWGDDLITYGVGGV